MEISSTHPCAGGCGRAVSGNKQKCLRCLGVDVAAALEAKGIEPDHEEIRRLLIVHAG